MATTEKRMKIEIAKLREQLTRYRDAAKKRAAKRTRQVYDAATWTGAKPAPLGVYYIRIMRDAEEIGGFGPYATIRAAAADAKNILRLNIGQGYKIVETGPVYEPVIRSDKRVKLYLHPEGYSAQVAGKGVISAQVIEIAGNSERKKAGPDDLGTFGVNYNPRRRNGGSGAVEHAAKHERQAQVYAREAGNNPGGPAAKAQLSHMVAARAWDSVAQAERALAIYGQGTAASIKRAAKKAEKLSAEADAAHGVWQEHRAAVERIKGKFVNPRAAASLRKVKSGPAAKLHFPSRESAWSAMRALDAAGISAGFPSLGPDASGYYTVQVPAADEARAHVALGHSNPLVAFKTRSGKRVSFDAKRRNPAYGSGLNENAKIVVEGVKGMKSTPFRKTFRNFAAYLKWSDSDAASNCSIYRVSNE